MSATLADVLRDAPALHGPAEADVLLTHGLLEEALRFIDRSVRDGDRTLETGSGYSTILFALRGAEHVCITPSQPEIDRIRAYCGQRGILTDRLSVHVDVSERVLPHLDLGQLDLVLIDGSHSFPQVFLDWFYTASALRVGGHLIVDDVHVWTGKVLRDFLVAEPEWELLDEFGGRTAILRKTAQTDPDRLWIDQPYVRRHSYLGARMMARQSLSMLRHGHSRDLLRRARGVLRSRLRRA
jgi:predicted O-methyltransferase YrrM